MLRKFRVSNFKSFDNLIELDFTNVNDYDFNTQSIRQETINNSIIYGHNGVGKSNLGLALFDIIEHLTDKQRNETAYKNYLNAISADDFAYFGFEFLINSKTVFYEYKKSDYKTILFERFSIDGVTYIEFDRTKQEKAIVLLDGTDNLKTDIENPELSILKYIKNNSELRRSETNDAFLSFFSFVEKMLYFRTLLMDRTYLGLEVGSRNILEDIVANGNLLDFEKFLNDAGIECKLTAVESLVKKNDIAFDFNDKKLLFSDVASTGTNALALFYFWFQTVKKENSVSFLFIDEFDAFYHHSLSALIVKKLKETNVQFILTTHNTSIMSNDLLRPDCYFLMTKSNIRSLANCTAKELREAHNIEKMYKAGAFYE